MSTSFTGSNGLNNALAFLWSSIYSLSAPAQPTQLPTQPQWKELSNIKQEPSNACKIHSPGLTEPLTPCTLVLKDNSRNPALRLGPGLIKTEVTSQGETILACEQLIALAPSSNIKNPKTTFKKLFKLQENKKNLALDKAGDGETNLVDNSYRLYKIKSSSFLLPICAEGTSSPLAELAHYKITSFYNSSNPSLDQPTALDAMMVANFTELYASLLDKQHFFETILHPGANNASFCDNLCPPGYQAMESYLEGDSGKHCDRRNNAILPFHDPSYYDYTYYCQPCTPNTYRTFTFKKINSADFDLQCQYECHDYTPCPEYLRRANITNEFQDQICDCEANDQRVVIVPPEVVSQEISVNDDGGYGLNETSTLQTARYFGNEEDYSFFCQAWGQYCLANTDPEIGAYQVGVTFPLVSDTCYILNVDNTVDSFDRVASITFQIASPGLSTAGLAQTNPLFLVNDNTTVNPVTDRSSHWTKNHTIITATVGGLAVITATALAILRVTWKLYPRKKPANGPSSPTQIITTTVSFAANTAYGVTNAVNKQLSETFSDNGDAESGHYYDVIQSKGDTVSDYNTLSHLRQLSPGATQTPLGTLYSTFSTSGQIELVSPNPSSRWDYEVMETAH